MEWRRNHLITLEKLKEINETYPTPYHLYDEKGIRENAERLNKAFAWNKGFREYFAVKATPNPFIIDILKKTGSGSGLFLTYRAYDGKGYEIRRGEDHVFLE